jgi:hypothetical protein
MLLQVDCTPEGSASFYLQEHTGAKLLRLRAESVEDVTVAGTAEKLTCDTKQRRVTADYTEDGILHRLSFAK